MRMLFTCRPLAGHYGPLLPLATAARQAGHTVAVASGEPIASVARSAGFGAFEAGPPDTFRRDWAPLFPHFRQLTGDEQRAFFFIRIFADLELTPRAADLESIVSAWQPDLIVHEVAELAGPLVATAAGIPYADVGFGALIPRPLLLAAGQAAAPQWRRRGLDPDPLGGLFRYLYIDPCPPALQNDEIRDVRSVQLLRPMADEIEAAEPPDWLTVLPRRPTVYLTLGTVWNTELDIFRLVIDAIGGHDVNLIVTVGRNNEPAALGPQPANVIVRDFVPQHQILSHCDVVVTHGGSGTVLGALAFGLPLLVLPQGADQWSNAERVVASGAGRSLIGGELTKEAVRESVSRLLADPAFRTAAQKIGAQIRSMPPVEAGLLALESLHSAPNGDTPRLPP